MHTYIKIHIHIYLILQQIIHSRTQGTATMKLTKLQNYQSYLEVAWYPTMQLLAMGNDMDTRKPATSLLFVRRTHRSIGFPTSSERKRRRAMCTFSKACVSDVQCQFPRLRARATSSTLRTWQLLWLNSSKIDCSSPVRLAASLRLFPPALRKTTIRKR